MKTLDISIAGEINLDLIMYGLPELMPLEREFLGTEFQVTLGSSSAILAHNLAVLGAHVGFVTLVGEDPLGRVALERLGESGADLTHVRVTTDGTATGVTLVLPHGTRGISSPIPEPWRRCACATWTSTISNLRNTSICRLYFPPCVAARAARALQRIESGRPDHFARHQRRPQRTVGRGVF